MKVKIEYIDDSAISEEEVIAQMKHIFGSSAYIETYPDNTGSETLIKYAIKNIITSKQVISFFDDPKLAYAKQLQELKTSVLSICEELFDEVVEENEEKWG